ncbi:zinc finger protein 280D isoform X2 [Megalops cyprinoides]|uniref:zinc finger protein 280D isoform X2 n=1 Tax=Megalops cyprinoides TaxID=118141 RepID=UPI0018646C18|nr:zinc finger protein 280D isoform X2 [Megalops cyprinoides]
MSELFMECEEEELEPWQRRIPEINLVDDDDDDDDEPIFVGEIRSSKVTTNTRPIQTACQGPAPAVKPVNQRQTPPAATRSIMPVSPLVRAGGGATVTAQQRAPQVPATPQPVPSCGPVPIVPQLAVRAPAQSVTKSLLIPMAPQPASLTAVSQSAAHGLPAQPPQPIIINNQGYIVASPPISNNSTFIASLGNQYPPGTSFTVLPAGQQLLQQVTPTKAVPGVVHRPQVQLIQNNVVTLANVQTPPQPKQPGAQFQPAKLQPIQMNATTLQPIQVVSSPVQGKLLTPAEPQPSPLLQVVSNSGSGTNAAKRESAPDPMSNTSKRTKLDSGASQNGTPFRKKCPRCNIQFNLPGPMKNHMRYCCSLMMDSVFPTTSKQFKPAAKNWETDKGKLIMLVTEFYYGRHEGDKPLDQEQKTNTTFKCNTCQKVLKNNVRFMNHMKHHLELEKQSNESWDSHTTCQHCFRQYATPFQLQCHIESAHSPYESTTNCKICELAFETEQVLLEHMKDNHKPGEMPYICQVCNYRSSFFSDVENHFRTVHENTKDLLCPFCLKVLRCGIRYMQHCMRHQKKGIHKCGKCRLNFLTYRAKTEHRVEFHRTFKKPKTLEGLPPGTKVTIRASLQGGSATSANAPSRSIVVPSSPGSKPPGKPQSSTSKSKSSAQGSSPGKARSVQNKRQERLNSKLQERSNEVLKNVRNHFGEQMCVECCTKITDFYTHYPAVLNCGACKYRTSCKRSFENHMIRFHSAVSRDRYRKMKRPRGSLRSITLVCLNCDLLADASGSDLMSKHLIDRPNHTCQVIIEKGICPDEPTKTELGNEASAGDTDSKGGETHSRSEDLDPADTGRSKDDPPKDSQSKSTAQSAEDILAAKDSKTASEGTERSDTQQGAHANTNDGDSPQSKVGELSGPEAGPEAPEQAGKEGPGTPSSPTGPRDDGEAAGKPGDDVPFEDFLRKADKRESACADADAGEQGSVHLEPLTPSKVLEHEATEILQKGSSPPPDGGTSDPSSPSGPDKAEEPTA